MNSIEKYSRNLYVSLGSQIDLERLVTYSRNAQIEELLKPDDFVYFKVENLKEASLLCQNFITHFRLGSSNWVGGRVVDEENNFVATISYNGRTWDSENWKIANEIEIC